MRRFGKYIESDSMSALVDGGHRILLVMSRFGIRLGFGDKTIKQVCEDNNVDTGTFLAIANMLLDADLPSHNSDDNSIRALTTYLHNSHNYFLDFRLPEIRSKLKTVVGEKEPLAKAIINYFDEYVAQVNKHMKYEESKVFPYVTALLQGEKSTNYNITEFELQHDQIDEKLREFKNIIIKYYSAEITNELNSVLFDIFSCEHDLNLHNAVENHLFTPAVKELEQRKSNKNES